MLSIVNLAEKVSAKHYKAYQLNENCQLHIICYDEHINVDETVFKFGSKEERRIYSAIDMMYMIMVPENILQLTEFDEKSQKERSTDTFLGWGLLIIILSFYKKKAIYLRVQ